MFKPSFILLYLRCIFFKVTAFVSLLRRSKCFRAKIEVSCTYFRLSKLVDFVWASSHTNTFRWITKGCFAEVQTIRKSCINPDFAEGRMTEFPLLLRDYLFLLWVLARTFLSPYLKWGDLLCLRRTHECAAVLTSLLFVEVFDLGLKSVVFSWYTMCTFITSFFSFSSLLYFLRLVASLKVLEIGNCIWVIVSNMGSESLLLYLVGFESLHINVFRLDNDPWQEWKWTGCFVVAEVLSPFPRLCISLFQNNVHKTRWIGWCFGKSC